MVIERAQTVPRYVLARRIGSGGMAEIYEARHELTARRVAVKLTKTDKGRARERFTREVKALGALSHESIVGIIDAGFTSDEVPYLVMDFVDGRVLRQVMNEDSPLGPTRVCRLMLAVARALAYAHAAGVIHRDLKPDNIMVVRRPDGGELPVLIDFGIARIEQADTNLTSSGAVLGTPNYMPPEQARGELQLGSAVDVYSFGVLFYELLTGRRAHIGESRQAVLHHILYHRVKPLPRGATDPYPDVHALVMSCLSKQAHKRPTAAALVERLSSALRSGGALTDDTAMPTTDLPFRTKRTRPVAAIAGTLILGLAAGWSGKSVKTKTESSGELSATASSVATTIAVLQQALERQGRSACLPINSEMNHWLRDLATFSCESSRATHTTAASHQQEDPVEVEARSPASGATDKQALRQRLLDNPYAR